LHIDTDITIFLPDIILIFLKPGPLVCTTSSNESKLFLLKGLFFTLILDLFLSNNHFGLLNWRVNAAQLPAHARDQHKKQLLVFVLDMLCRIIFRRLPVALLDL